MKKNVFILEMKTIKALIFYIDTNGISNSNIINSIIPLEFGFKQLFNENKPLGKLILQS
jgi:hypothetical protein